MKYFAILFIVLSSFVTKAQTSAPSIAGTWELTEFTFNGSTVVPQLHGFKRYKSFTPTHFVVTEINAETGAITTTIFGTYLLTGTTYTEQILNTTKGSSTGKYTATLKFDNEDALVLLGNVNNSKMDERWQRVKGYSIWEK